ncbi:condensation domain-containing protein [Kitasatospora sp. GP82]|uniref:condensation domain-containing protein n=1 Tax=Kitasatospora sp. GP82 TaxID=3035089 RepID=UPI0024755F03|nr:condensation domain-containing protein [Kitasatospora sp. GP82]MDH6128354.1 non-ribosomal peptide synthase protein (TIGR01720 family) [Kitasatospora sp. GP82]
MIERHLGAVLARHPERTAIVCGDVRIGYRELGRRIAGLRTGLHGIGVAPGDLVLLALPNCPEFVITYFATAGLGAAVLAVDPRSTEHELRSRLAGGRPAAVVTTAGLAPVLARLAGALEPAPEVVVVGGGSGSHHAFDDLVRDGTPVPMHPAQADDPWVHTYSSGSTGEPRRICRSQANQVAEATQIITSAAITTDDVVLCPVPLFHALGQFCCLIVSVLAGATLVLLEPRDEDAREGAGRLDPEAVLSLIEEHRVTVFPSVPYILGALADWPADRAADLSSVRLCLSGSNFLPQTVRERFQDRFAVPVRQTYGSSEAGSVAWDCDPDEVVPESVGRPLAGVTVEILDENGEALPAGSVGEIAVTGGSVMLGEAAPDGELVRADGRYLTGDLGRLGEDGRLYLTGRKRILVDTGGHKVNPVEVEELLESHPDVRSAAVVGVPVDGGGDLLVAVVVPAGEPDAERLRAYCRERLAEHKVPSRFEFADDLPRTALGKIRRAELASRLADLAPPGPGPVRPPEVWDVADPAARERLITDQLLWRTAEILGCAPGAVDPELPLRSQGLDSLGALRLKMAVQDDLRRVVGLPELLGAASAGSLARRLAQEPEEAVEPLVAQGVLTGEFPLSHNQLSIWHADQIAPENAAYNQSFAARITSRCDPQVLRRSFQALVDRHPVLRTTFGVRAGGPFQRVAGPGAVDFAVVEVPEKWADRSAELSAEAFRPFDLTQEPPLRVRLYLGAADGPVLLVTLHHIATDFWSMVAMLRELEAVHAAEAAGAELYRPAPRHAYTDYVRWQAEAVAGPAGRRDWEYWRTRLSPRPPALELPVDGPRPVVQSQRGSTFFQELGTARVQALQEFARARGCTVYTVLLAVFQVFLHGMTAERDIAVAAITTNRQRSEFRDVLGYFVNPVVCRTQLDPERSFTELLETVRHELHQGLDHQLLPFETLVERLDLKRDRSRAPLVEVAFGQNKAQDAGLLALSRFLTGGSGHELRLGALVMESIELHQRGVVYDFSGAVYEAADSVSIAWEYNSDLFRPSTVERMADQYGDLLSRLLERPGHPVGGIEAVGGEIRRTLLDASRGSAAAHPADTLVQVIRREAGLRPDRMAVVAQDAELTYRQVWERAARLAAALRAAGLRAGDRAVLWLPCSSELAVAGLAVLVAGGVCDALPFDTDVRELRAVLAEDDVRVLVTTASGQSRVGAVDRAVLRLGEYVPAAAQDAPAAAVGPEDGALVLRSSGVTGRPTAYVHTHRALTTWATWLAGLRTGPGGSLVHGGLRPDRMLARLLGALAGGGTAVLTDAGADPAGLVRLLTGGRRLGLVEVTAAELAGLLAALAEAGRRPSVDTLLVSGDALPGDLVRRWRQLAGPARVVHSYGGADTALAVSAHEVPQQLAAERPVSSGRPVGAAVRYVLDAAGRLAPVGVPGEICVDADVLARPLHGAGRTAEHWFPDPDAERPGARLYRTGDLGWYLPDGEVVAAGRVGDVVELRGYRIALPAVEAELLRLPAVVGARAMTVGEEDRRLVAYVALDPAAAAPTAAELREVLRAVLPEYQLPAEIVPVGHLPAAGNGKTDRSGPPASAPGPATAEPGIAPPAEVLSPMEARLAAIWSEVLDVAHVRPQDDYFDLDGDSITSMRIVSLAAEHGIRITPRQVFTHPTLRELAAVAEETRRPEPAEPPRAEPDRAAADVPLAPVQRWFLEQELAQRDRWNQAVLLRADRRLDRATLHRALRAVADHHPAFRFRYTRTAQGWHQSVDPDTAPVLILDHPGGLPEALAAVHAAPGLAAGPVLVAAVLADDSADGHRVLLAAHHLVVDFVSWQIVIEDLTRACEQLLAGQQPRLRPAATPFAEWTRLLHRYADSPEVTEQLGYWTTACAGLDEPPALPSAERDSRTGSATLPAARTAALLAATDRREPGHRIQDVLLAAVLHALAGWTGRRRVRADVEGHGREEFIDGVDLTRTVGWFTTMHPLVLDLGPDDDPARAYRAARAALRAVPSGGVGYGLLRYASSDPAMRQRMAELPQSTVNFNYLGRMGRLVDGGARTVPDGQLFEPLPLDAAGDRGPANRRPYSLEVSALLADDGLSLRVRHSATEYRPSQIEEFLGLVLDGVSAIVADIEAGHAHQLAGGRNVIRFVRPGTGHRRCP